MVDEFYSPQTAIIEECSEDPLTGMETNFFKVEQIQYDDNNDDTEDSKSETEQASQRSPPPRGRLKFVKRRRPAISRHDIDTEDVIEAVRARPMLWDKRHDLYKDRCARVSAWKDVYEMLYPEYHSMEYNLQKRIGAMVQMRWKTARDTYMKYKNMIKTSGRKIKSYSYANKLTFLDKGQNTDKRKPTIVHTQNNGVEHRQPTAPIHTENTEPQSTRQERIMLKRTKESCDMQKEMLCVLKQNLNLLKNDDLAFFMSLLPITEKFSIHEKLSFRAEIIRTAMKMSNKNGE